MVVPQDSLLNKRILTRPPGWGMRHVLIFLGFTGFALSYAMRVNISIAIVAMVKRNTSAPHNQTVTDQENMLHGGTAACPSLMPSTSSNNSKNLLGYSPSHLGESDEGEGEFDWDEIDQGIILGSFFYGYMVTQLPGGLMAQKYGGKWPLGIGLFVTAIFALLTPIAARTHVGLLIACRVIQGLGEGVTTPCMHLLLSKWVPPEERGTLASITYSGTSFGTALTMIGSGYLIQSGLFGGWPSVFYVIGGISLVWFVLWCFFVSDSPSDHPTISGDELYYIQRSIGDQLSKENVPTPWRHIMTSLPVWVIIVSHTGHTYGLYTLLTELPTYMKTVLNFNIKENSWMSALPYALMSIVGFIIPILADVAIKKGWMDTLTVRKVCQIIAHFGGALALIGAAYSGCDTNLTVALLTIAGGVQSAAFAGFGVNHIDIASNHAGLLMGVTNTVANISGFLGPYIAGVLINGHSTIENWRIVFFIAAGIYILDTIFFLLFASADEQPWNREGANVTTPLLQEAREISYHGHVHHRRNRTMSSMSNFSTSGVINL